MQHSFANILKVLGTPTKSFVPRVNPKGSESGVKLDKRESHREQLRKTLALSQFEFIDLLISSAQLALTSQIKADNSLLTRLRKSLDGMLLIQSPIPQSSSNYYLKGTRKRIRISTKNLAYVSNTHLRFVIELDQGKPT